MYLNPSETQMLKSLDLQLGGTNEAAATNAAGTLTIRDSKG